MRVRVVIRLCGAVHTRLVMKVIKECECQRCFRLFNAECLESLGAIFAPMYCKECGDLLTQRHVEGESVEDLMDWPDIVL
jgi:hypothetical protein